MDCGPQVSAGWEQDGSGRADAQVTGGDLTGTETASECWDTTFLSVYLDHSYDETGWGSAEACVYAEADYSQL